MNALHWYDKTYDLWRPWLLPMGHGFMAHSRDHTSSETVDPLIPSGTLAASQRPHPQPPIGWYRETLIMC